MGNQGCTQTTLVGLSHPRNKTHVQGNSLHAWPHTVPMHGLVRTNKNTCNTAARHTHTQHLFRLSLRNTNALEANAGARHLDDERGDRPAGRRTLRTGRETTRQRTGHAHYSMQAALRWTDLETQCQHDMVRESATLCCTITAVGATACCGVGRKNILREAALVGTNPATPATI